MTVIKRIGVLTSGGDAPGMNAAIRAVVRSASAHEIDVVGIRNGYRGLIEGDFDPLDNRAVGGIMLRGGTTLGSARSAAFQTDEGRQQALDNLSEHGIQSLVVIGGNGSQAGGLSLHNNGFPVVGVASTIDNDLSEVDMSIGVDTALNTALQMVDRLRDTASSHHRAFVVETMGRKSGYLALMTGISSGAEVVCIPEVESSLEEIHEKVHAARDAGKTHVLIIVAEGSSISAQAIVDAMNTDGCYETRLSILGHVQRGGSPLAFDRLLGSRTGYKAVQGVVDGESGVVAALSNGKISLVPTREAILPSNKVTPALLKVSNVLSK